MAIASSVPNYVEGYRLDRPINEIKWDIPKIPADFLKVGFLNILSTYVWHRRDDTYRNKFAYFQWETRCPAIIELIHQERPAVLGLCELDLRQIKDLQKEMAEKQRLEGYQLIGFSTQTGETIEASKRYSDNEWDKYGTFVAALINTALVHVKEPPVCHALPTYQEQRWKTVLMEARLIDKIADKAFVFLVSHFDYHTERADIRAQSCDLELEIIRRFEKQGIPCLSVGDRNWSSVTGEEEAKRYIASGVVVDMRDHNQYGCFGQSGTFRRSKRELVTLDTGYRSASLTEGVLYYTRAGKYDPATRKLLPDPTNLKKLQNSGFISDHLMVITGIRFKKRS